MIIIDQQNTNFSIYTFLNYNQNTVFQHCKYIPITKKYCSSR